MSGLELLRHIRQDAVLRNIPIIMMSNTDQVWGVVVFFFFSCDAWVVLEVIIDRTCRFTTIFNAYALCGGYTRLDRDGVSVSAGGRR